ncbi:nucleotidyl transferase AbiEii/AbiGii toxin family protein [Candidatus Wolfebacteria bacterium]|nr:nucleotidyl transferase AbiEii/AbiGii toxin family protein [Candidatus Wolfebacteria bacterium]
MYSKTINKQTKRVLDKIATTSLCNQFYLAGGTALAIELGHRKSIDLDWFSKKDFLNSEIKEILSKVGVFVLNSEADGTIHGVLDKVRVSFLRYKYNLLFPLISFENIQLADERDIASMKIDAISSRGSKKDFIDLYFLLKKYSLFELIGFFGKKYSGIKYNRLHILKSLTYFSDANNEPMPKMIESLEWEEVKKHIYKETHILLVKNIKF